MRSLVSTISDYLGSPLMPSSKGELTTRLLPTVAAAILAAVLLVHAFSPAGLTFSELLTHVLSIWLSFLLGMFLAGLLVFWLMPRRAPQPTVGLLWLISTLGFVLGLVLVWGVDSMGFLAETAAKAASLHGPQSMLLRLLPVWALVTAYLVRSQMLDAYESRFGALRLQAQQSPGDPETSSAVVLGSGKSSVEVDVSSIVMVGAEENYCRIAIVKEGCISSTLVRATLQSVEQKLPAERFVRLHRSHLVNIGHVQRVRRRGRRFFVVLRHWEDEVPISRNRVNAVLARLEA